ERLVRLQNADEEAARLLDEITHLKDALYAQYVSLSAIRKQAGKRLAAELLNELSDLGMQNAKFEARFEPLASRDAAVFCNGGIDEMEFYISTNAGEPLKPLSKTASGGEISRIMLAFKNISAGIDNISTMIFDEIDTGISGKMALVVSEKMASIARSRQVICVTHLPQIAAMADANFLIRKYSKCDETNTTVMRLDGDGVIDEIARLAGGIETVNSQKYARELQQNAQKIKKVFNS
ncbi:MAG: DNA repair protein RecN, partial [Christensenella sp.]